MSRVQRVTKQYSCWQTPLEAYFKKQLKYTLGINYNVKNYFKCHTFIALKKLFRCKFVLHIDNYEKTIYAIPLLYKKSLSWNIVGNNILIFSYSLVIQWYLLPPCLKHGWTITVDAQNRIHMWFDLIFDTNYTKQKILLHFF